MKSYLIKDTTKEERIALIKEWIPDEDGIGDSGMDLWDIPIEERARVKYLISDMYDPYIRGEKEISECNAAFQTGFYEEKDFR